MSRGRSEVQRLTFELNAALERERVEQLVAMYRREAIYMRQFAGCLDDAHWNELRADLAEQGCSTIPLAGYEEDDDELDPFTLAMLGLGPDPILTKPGESLVGTVKVARDDEVVIDVPGEDRFMAVLCGPPPTKSWPSGRFEWHDVEELNAFCPEAFLVRHGDDEEAPLLFGVWLPLDDGVEDLLGAGDTHEEAIADARETVRGWDAKAKG